MWSVTFENGQFFDVSADNDYNAEIIACAEMPHAGGVVSVKEMDW